MDSKLLRNSCIIVDREIERFFWLRQELKKYKSPSVCSMKVCLELLIFFSDPNLSHFGVRSVTPCFSSARCFCVSHCHVASHYVTSRSRHAHITLLSRLCPFD